MSDTDYLERRNFFRVDDDVAVSCQPISAEDKEEGIERLKSQALELPDVSRLFLTLESSLQDHIVKVKDSNLKEALHLMNRKMNLLAHGGLVNEAYKTIMTKPSQTVSLSASGVGFYTNHNWQKGDSCTVELVLMPAKTYLFSYGHVISCETVASKSLDEDEEQFYRVGVSFDFMREEDMERLIQHIMRVEAELIRQAKQSLSP